MLPVLKALPDFSKAHTVMPPLLITCRSNLKKLRKNIL
jgi:hypothetical protein